MSVAGFAALASVLMVAAGCGAVHVSPVDMAANQGQEMVEDSDLGKVYLAPGFFFRGYDVLVIGDVAPGAALPMKDIDPEAMGIYFKSSLVRQLAQVGVFGRVTDDKSALAPGGGRVVVLESTFSDLDPGNRALRWIAGFGAGRTKVQVETELKDPQTKQVLFRASDRRVGALGAFGGSTEGFILESLDKIAEAHANFIKRVAATGKADK